MTSVLNGMTMTRRIASNFKKDTVDLLNGIRGQIIALEKTGYLNSPLHTRNMRIQYRSLNNDVMDIEVYRYLAIVNYREREDGYFEDVLVRIYKEIGSLQTCPFVSTCSNSDTYYWAEIGSGMIALPYGEERNILNLSDLYHEIGHFLYDQHKDDFIGDLTDQIDTFYRQKQGTFNLAIEALNRWEKSWLEEFACDLIATFLTGPAYAWTNLKFTTASSVLNVYGNPQLQSYHPANEARMRAIFAMLHLTGHDAELAEIQESWDDFLNNIRANPPADYQDLYPQEFIDRLAQTVLDGCRDIALRPYSEQLVLTPAPVSLAINEAWKIINTLPDDFKPWEEAKVAELGLTDN
ncbi:MAG: hypothetical protein WBP58_02990 [Chitinophagaceae bacterium]